jgi:D-alanine-D-alanine ligase-like ATP-grasp enzyme
VQLTERRKRIAVMFGAASPEYDVSVVTAQQLMDAVDPEKYEVLPVFVDFENRLFVGGSLQLADTGGPATSRAFSYRLSPDHGLTVASAGPKFGWNDTGAAPF